MTFPVPGGATFLRAEENLSDVADAETARENLGVDEEAVQAEAAAQAFDRDHDPHLQRLTGEHHA